MDSSIQCGCCMSGVVNPAGGEIVAGCQFHGFQDNATVLLYHTYS